MESFRLSEPMKFVCSICANRISDLGPYCFYLCDYTTWCFFNGVEAIFDDDEEFFIKKLSFSLSMLEKSGYLISSEICINKIGILPNVDNAFFDDCLLEICWCEDEM